MGDLAKDLPFFNLFIPGLGYTVIISLGAIAIGLVIGFLAGLGRTTQMGWLRWILGAYVEIMRSLPLLVLLFFAYYAIPTFTGVQVSPLTAAVVTQGVYIGAYITEVVKGGIQAVPAGQWEAARALGLNYPQMMLRVITPQALKIMTPPMISLLITSVKESSLASIIGVVEITRVAVDIRTTTFSIWPPLLALAAIYLVLNLVISAVGSVAERRFGLKGVRLNDRKLMT